MGKPKFGVFLPFYAFNAQQGNPQALFSQIRSTVLLCEELGYDSVWLDDHLMFGEKPILECWTTLAALAASTKRIRLGTMVTTNGFRSPALLAKMAATVDAISEGRLELGLGAGISGAEHAAYGFLFPKPAERINRLKESVEIVKSLWTEPKTTYRGKFFQLEQAVCEPKPVQKPHPPIIIGGSGEKFLLKVTAQQADRFDFGYLPTFETYKHKMDALQERCKAVGREFGVIEKSCWPTGQIIIREDKPAQESAVKNLKPAGISRAEFEKYTFIGKPAEFRAQMKPFLDLDVTYFMLFFLDLPDASGLQLFAQEAVGKKSV